MEFISIGPNCDTADTLKIHNLRNNAYPFDYIFSSLEMIKHIINDKFKIFLDKTYFENGTFEGSTKHSFYCKYLDTDILLRHHQRWIQIPADYKVSNGNIFNHHDLINNESHYDGFKRRADRLLNLIENNKKIVFVYYNFYTNTFDDIIDFYKSFSNYENIFILGIFKNNEEKKILYENKNCRIYQNYDDGETFNEIKTIFDLIKIDISIV